MDFSRISFQLRQARAIQAVAPGLHGQLCVPASPDYVLECPPVLTHAPVLGPFALDLRVFEVVDRRGQGPCFIQVREVHAGAHQSAAGHHQAKAHHSQCAAGMANQLEELIADPLGQAQGAETDRSRTDLSRGANVPSARRMSRGRRDRTRTAQAGRRCGWRPARGEDAGRRRACWRRRAR